MYKSVIKRLLDILLSSIALGCLIWLYIVIAIAIYVDDPGPVLFTQKRVGKGKKHFYLHKFRTMKVSAPHDVPTHLLNNANEYITRVGRFLRKTSLDELPQIWDIFIGKMSIVGPRPALWNQYDLISERDKYGVNDIRPGLTGLAQINGRDGLEIAVKANFDGKYAKVLHDSGFAAFALDAKCFFATILRVLKSDGIVEGKVEDKNELENISE